MQEPTISTKPIAENRSSYKSWVASEGIRRPSSRDSIIERYEAPEPLKFNLRTIDGGSMHRGRKPARMGVSQ